MPLARFMKVHIVLHAISGAGHNLFGTIIR